ncbi:hypothetical protein [Asanoa iriomotensis]|uniref:DUF5655 domain-containing protein n=1 Tax=Asanoa iriomotensis TaxID=234613 RepID=A0ABQ4BYV7_9ACTN|nr:hypothetical protein [Asanoa iriomotensis]GIF55361.1 hypothetical protein Air01nite_14560 [Asanoa iriomotensis]
MTLSDSAANRDLLTYLCARATRGSGGPYEQDGWELHTHPDLVERLGEIARSDRAVVAVYGYAVLEQKGVAVVVALGTSHLLFRLRAAPEGVVAATPIEPLCGNGRGWHAVDAWSSDARRLVALVKDARRHANTLEDSDLG